ncbi:MAG: Motility accessory factor [Candidatus Ozemobacter sibiricus]|uniref:Motility accessory factor n=1 Tax=Candidatus Ozemobacter sibiricus TaxID=2268124 RepID=A0A367ZNT3_9BACT|nr:MAG: Motility accessory factor [Candidatus Ozemobacter sibiricus]
MVGGLASVADGRSLGMTSRPYARNMKVLRQRHPALARMLDRAAPVDLTYVVEPAKNGAPTLTVRRSDKAYQVHSRYDPAKEALQQVQARRFRNARLIMVLGLGLGYHLRACLQHHAAEVVGVIVIEPDPQAMKAALEAVDLTDLLESDQVRWVVGVPEAEAYAALHSLLQQAGVGVQLFLKTLVIFEHPVLAQLHADYFRTMVRAFREAAHTIIFNYGNCPKDSMVGVENIMGNLSTIIRNPGIKQAYGAFRGVPGVLVSTGPSLDRNIGELPRAVGKCVMICADSALKVLYAHGIKPHATASVERLPEVADLFTAVPEDWRREIWLAATPVIMPQVYRVWTGPTVIVYRQFAHFEWLDMPKGMLPIGPSCANLAFKVLEALGCDPIILVGQDCSFPNVEKTHAAGASGITQLDLQQSQLYKVRGNEEEWVYTDQIFDLFRKTFVTDVAAYRGTCINATEGGAFIEGTVRMTLREAIDRYCQRDVEVWPRLAQVLAPPSAEEIAREWRKFKRIMEETRTEVEGVIKFCQDGERMVAAFEDELNAGGYTALEDFLARFPADRLEQVYEEMVRQRGRIIQFGKYFQLYLMHIVQMIIVKFEMDFNELPTLCDDRKRCQLQAIRMMRRWFPTIGDVCRLALDLLNKAYAQLTQEFGA